MLNNIKKPVRLGWPLRVQVIDIDMLRIILVVVVRPWHDQDEYVIPGA
jgi:hypothetical protein